MPKIKNCSNFEQMKEKFEGGFELTDSKNRK